MKVLRTLPRVYAFAEGRGRAAAVAQKMADQEGEPCGAVLHVGCPGDPAFMIVPLAVIAEGALVLGTEAHPAAPRRNAR